MRAVIFGESHGSAIGVVLENVPAGLLLDMQQISFELGRRSPGDDLSTARRESDEPEIISGLYKGYTTGAPLCAVIKNNDARSSDYEKFKNLPRPGHADYAAYIRYSGYNDARGGGHFSGRLTAPLVFAGAVAKQFLAKRKISVGAHLLSIADVSGEKFDAVRVTERQLSELAVKQFPAFDDITAKKMKQRILEAKKEQDSAGGVIECAIVGLDAGVGEPGPESLESLIAKHVFAVPGIKGIEFGAGFGFASMRGSEANDEMSAADGKVEFLTNNNGGISGGISTGAPVIFRAAVRPTPSIAKKQRTIDLASRCGAELVIEGRHDPCIAHRALPAVEAAAALALMEALKKTGGEWHAGKI